MEALNQSVQVTSVNTVNAASKDFREILDSEAISTELDDELRNMTKQSFYKVPYGNYKKSTINIGQSSEDEIDTGRYQIRRSNEDVEIYDKKTQQKFGWILRYGDEVQVDSQSNQKFLINDFGNGFFMMQYVDDELENGLKKFFDVDELPEKAGFTTVKSKYVNAPVIKELPVALECELIKVIDDNKYLGRIKNVSVDESVLGEDGEISLDKFAPITYDPVHHGYYKLGEKVGNAFKDGAKLK